jgi:hypothetical protein
MRGVRRLIAGKEVDFRMKAGSFTCDDNERCVVVAHGILSVSF